jgi:hypothetical protein
MKIMNHSELPRELILKPIQVPVFENYPTITYDYIIGMIHNDRIPSKYDVEKIVQFFQENQNYGEGKKINLKSPLASLLFSYDHYKI